MGKKKNGSEIVIVFSRDECDVAMCLLSLRNINLVYCRSIQYIPISHTQTEKGALVKMITAHKQFKMYYSTVKVECIMQIHFLSNT